MRRRFLRHTIACCIVQLVSSAMALPGPAIPQNVAEPKPSPRRPRHWQERLIWLRVEQIKCAPLPG